MPFSDKEYMEETSIKTSAQKKKTAVSIPVNKLTLRKKREKGRNALKWFTIALITAGVVPAFLGESNSFSGALSVTFISIVLEAFPFILLGTLVGGIIEEFVSRDMIASIVPKNKYLAAFIAAGAGVVFPVCECAIIPVTRRLVLKGVPFSAAVAYLIAGPIVNPVTFASTGMAYLWDWKIAVIRLLCGYGI
ncbi:MAG: hypothetical protein GF307_03905, partial [candidate division Zixibacteria bacterium]|nr:hypothetical protein [candidate division Zixibacteria bacterium]